MTQRCAQSKQLKQMYLEMLHFLYKHQRDSSGNTYKMVLYDNVARRCEAWPAKLQTHIYKRRSKYLRESKETCQGG